MSRLDKMSGETFRMVMAYLIASIIIIFGMIMIARGIENPNPSPKADTYLLGISGLVGAASTWVFTQASASQASRAMLAGVNTTGGPTSVPPPVPPTGEEKPDA